MIDEVVLNDNEEIVQWFQEAFVGPSGVFQDPNCGNGQCETPLEFVTCNQQFLSNKPCSSGPLACFLH